MAAQLDPAAVRGLLEEMQRQRLRALLEPGGAMPPVAPPPPVPTARPQVAPPIAGYDPMAEMSATFQAGLDPWTSPAAPLRTQFSRGVHDVAADVDQALQGLGPTAYDLAQRVLPIPQFYGPGADIDSLLKAPGLIGEAWQHGTWGDVGRESLAGALAAAGVGEYSKMLHASELFGPTSATAHAEIHELRHGGGHGETHEEKHEEHPTAHPDAPPHVPEEASYWDRIKAAGRGILEGALDYRTLTGQEPAPPEAQDPRGLLERIIDMPVEQREQSMAALDYLNVPARALGAPGVEPLTARRVADAATTLAANAPEIGMAAGGVLKKGATGTPKAKKQAAAIRQYYGRGLMESTADLRGLPVDEAIDIARTEQHLQPNPNAGMPDEGAFLGGPRSFQSEEDVLRQRDWLDQYLRRDTRGADWYPRYRAGLSAAIGPPGTTFGNQSVDDWNAALQGQFSAGVAPESEIQFALKELNSRIAGRPAVGRFSAQSRALDEAIASGDWGKMQLGKKTGEYARRINPAHPQGGATGVNDFRHARNLGFTEPGGKPQTQGLSQSQHRYADYETALAVDRANQTALGGRTDWTGEDLQAVPWVVQKAADENARANKGLAKKQAAARKAGKPIPEGKSMEQSLQEANATIADYFPKQTFFETYESIPGTETGHLPGLLEASDAEKRYYSDWKVRGAPGGRDPIYGGTGIPGTGLTVRTEAPRAATGIYTNPRGMLETNPAKAVPVHVSIKHEKGGSKRIGEADRDILEAAMTLRGTLEAQNAMAGHMVFPRGKAGEKASLVVPKTGLLEKGQVKRLLELGKEAGLPDVVDVGRSVTLTDFAAGTSPSKQQVRALSQNIEKGGLGKRIRDIVPGTQPIERASIDSIYLDFTKQWRKGPGSGAMTRETLKKIGKTPELRRAFSQNPYLANAALDLIERDAAHAGHFGAVREDIQNFRRVIAEGPGWPDRLRQHLKKGTLALPSILLPLAVAAGVVQEKGSESQKQSY